MGAIVSGEVEQVPGLQIVDWKSSPDLRLRFGHSCRDRGDKAIRQVVVHSTKGWPDTALDPRQQRLLPGAGPDGHLVSVAKSWAEGTRLAGAHLIVDFDGSVGCCADLKDEAAYHVGGLNGSSIGIELYQGANAELYEAQMATLVLLVDWLTRRFGIQRQFHAPYRYAVGRLASGGLDCVGVFGHRDCSHARGPGDPGSFVFDALRAAGYEAFDFAAGDDLAAWKTRQASLAAGLVVDGIPGSATVDALRQPGPQQRAVGLWIARPGDPVIPPPAG